MKKIGKVCQESKDENTKVEYLLFISNVVGSAVEGEYEPAFFFQVLKQLLENHSRFLEYNKKLVAKQLN